MEGTKLPPRFTTIWSLSESQHGVVSRRQLLDAGLSSKAIEHRIKRGRLHPLWRGVYAVGRPEVDRLGRWMGAVLCCGPEALLGYRSAAALWGMIERAPETIEIVVPRHVSRRQPGIRVHRRTWIQGDLSVHKRIPTTGPAATLIDLATQLGDDGLEAAMNAADRLGLVDPESLREIVSTTPPRPGVSRTGRLLDRFTRTDSGLERQFLRLVLDAGLPTPETQVFVNGFRVDFYWPVFGLVVETDGLRYHRTPAQQARDLRREQVHVAAGLRALRFPAGQIRHDPSSVRATLSEVMKRPAAAPEGLSPRTG